MRPAPLRQALRRRLQHDPLRDADATQASELFIRCNAGVDVWKQAGLIEHERAYRGEIVDGAAVPECRKGIARGLVAKLRLVTQRE